jgi:hypothetical protein
MDIGLRRTVIRVWALSGSAERRIPSECMGGSRAHASDSHGPPAGGGEAQEEGCPRQEGRQAQVQGDYVPHLPSPWIQRAGKWTHGSHTVRCRQIFAQLRFLAKVYTIGADDARVAHQFQADMTCETLGKRSLAWTQPRPCPSLHSIPHLLTLRHFLLRVAG